MNGAEKSILHWYPKGINLPKYSSERQDITPEFEGYFACNDPFLNKMWEKSQRTLYITMRDTYMDCPDRERGLQWWGDEVNESGEAFYALSVSSHLLMKKGMYELIGVAASSQEEIFAPYPMFPSSKLH